MSPTLGPIMPFPGKEKTMYFVISNSDGDTTVDAIDQQELEKRLNDEYYGRAQFLNTIPTADTNYWGDGAILIIRGDIVVPRAEQIVTRFVI